MRSFFYFSNFPISFFLLLLFYHFVFVVENFDFFGGESDDKPDEAADQVLLGICFTELKERE
jgi:hypothetical protein